MAAITVWCFATSTSFSVIFIIQLLLNQLLKVIKRFIKSVSITGSLTAADYNQWGLRRDVWRRRHQETRRERKTDKKHLQVRRSQNRQEASLGVKRFPVHTMLPPSAFAVMQQASSPTHSGCAFTQAEGLWGCACQAIITLVRGCKNSDATFPIPAQPHNIQGWIHHLKCHGH